MRHVTQTEKEILHFLESRDKKLLDGTVLPHRTIFADDIQKEDLFEIIGRLTKEYGFLAIS